jgi:hypothetical protein
MESVATVFDRIDYLLTTPRPLISTSTTSEVRYAFMLVLTG